MKQRCYECGPGYYIGDEGCRHAGLIMTDEDRRNLVSWIYEHTNATVISDVRFTAIEKIVEAHKEASLIEGWNVGHSDVCPQGSWCSAHAPMDNPVRRARHRARQISEDAPW